MKYIEELAAGDSFVYNELVFVLTSDFKKNGDRQACSLKTGFCQWFSSQTIVKQTQIFTLDDNNNIVPVK